MVTSKVVLQGWNEVEAELGYLGELMAEQKKIAGELQAKIAQVNGEYAVPLSDIEAGIQTKIMLIEQFTRKNMGDIRDDGIMTKKFTTGVIKTKKHDDVEYPDNDELVEALKQLNLEQYIDTKKKPLKAALKAALNHDATLYGKLGIDVIETVKVTIKPYF